MVSFSRGCNLKAATVKRRAIPGTRANPDGQMARIVNVFTDADCRGMGIARTLIVDVMARCEALGVREFNLGASAEGRALYAALGFEAYPAEMRRRVSGAPVQT